MLENNYLYLKFEKKNNFVVKANTHEVIVPSESISLNLQAGHKLKF